MMTCANGQDDQRTVNHADATRDVFAYPAIIFGLVLRDVLDRVLLHLLLARLGLLVVFGRGRDFVGGLLGRARTLRLDVAGVRSRTAALAVAPLEGEVDLLRRRVDLDRRGERRGRQVSVDLGQASQGAGTRRELFEKVRGRRIARNATKDHTAAVGK